MKKRQLIIIIIFILLGISSFFYDTQILEQVNKLDNVYLGSFLSLFRPITIFFIFVLFVLFLLWKEHKRKYIKPTIYASISALAISFILKFVFMRARPFDLVKTISFTNLIDYSFPSSHTIIIFAILPLLDKEFPKFKYLWLALALLVGFSRIYFAEHYLSDVIFGAIIGYLIGFFIAKTIKKNKVKVNIKKKKR